MMKAISGGVEEGEGTLRNIRFKSLVSQGKKLPPAETRGPPVAAWLLQEDVGVPGDAVLPRTVHLQGPQLCLSLVTCP